MCFGWLATRVNVGLGRERVTLPTNLNWTAPSSILRLGESPARRGTRRV